ncbi:hypothetical protein [Chromohalobacter israelensis]|uniref:hypothetical protein n=1 Tax=Chromohalobacter israelensis TaxID=141390 RepID=UPI0015C48FDA|nr:hypothetical protein [Chromohalobacter salexigens]
MGWIVPRKKNSFRKINESKRDNIKLRNFARGRRGALISASVIKEASSLSKLLQNAVWFVRAFPYGEQVKHTLPNKPSAIPGISVGTSTSLEREIIWAVAILWTRSYKLSKYLSGKWEIEEFLADGEYFYAEQALNNLTNDVCWSHSSLALKLFLISENEGLEAQKDWVLVNILKKTKSPSAFFSYWLGVRQERGREPHDFESYFSQNFPVLYAESEESVFIQHILMARQANEYNEAKLIQQLQTQSIVDMYEGLVSHLINAACEYRESLRYYLKHLMPLMDHLDDFRSDKVRALLGNEGDISNLLSKGEWSASRFANEIRDGEKSRNFEPPKGYASGVLAATDLEKTERENRAFLGSLAYADVWSGMCSFLRATYQLRLVTKVKDVVALNRARFIFDRRPCAYLLGYVQDVTLESLGSSEYLSCDSSQMYFNVSRSIVKGDYERAKAILSDMAIMRGREDPEFLRLEIILALELSAWGHILERLYQALKKHKDCLSWLPYQEIASGLTDSVIEEHSFSPKISVVLSHLVAVVGDPLRSNLIYSSELYLEKEKGVHRPSELQESELWGDVILQEFILLCFTPETMALSLNYDNAKDMQDERLQHLSLLSNVGGSIREWCESEAEQIIRSQEIARAMSTVAESKIDCDEKELFSWARDSLQVKYERFRSFVDAGILPAPVDATRELIVAVREGDVGGKTFEIPSNEATSILKEITAELVRAYSFDPYFGLNSYLSLRVRHGTISGQLRRGCAEEKLLTTVDSDGDRYELNQYWLDVISENGSVDDARRVADRLGRFSRDFDALISSFSEENLQILTPEKPDGLVVTTFSDSTLFAFFSEAIKYDDFEDFLDAFSTVFWANLERNLENARSYINKVFRNEVMELFNGLEESIQHIADSPSLPPVSDAIVRARNSTNQSLDEVSNWFYASRSSDSDLFSIPDLGRISLEIAKRLAPEFSPEVNFYGDDEMMITSGLIMFTDVFGVLFDNVAKHSGCVSPKVDITYHVISDRFLRILFSSQCTHIDRARQAANSANQKFSDGDYSSALTEEGGTGLAKLSKIIQGSESSNPFFVSVDDERKTFDVCMEFSYLNLGGEGGHE